MPLHFAFKCSRAQMAAERKQRFEQRETTRAELAIADAVAVDNVVLPIPYVVRGFCRYCHKEVTNTDDCLRGKDDKGYFHILCDLERPNAVQKAVELFNTLKATPAAPGAAAAGVQAKTFFDNLMAAESAVEAAEAAANIGASTGGLLPPAPLFNWAACVP